MFCLSGLEKIGRLLKGDPQKLEAGLSHNTVVVEGKLVSSLLNREKVRGSLYVRALP